MGSPFLIPSSLVISDVLYFEPILEHIVFICHASPCNEEHISVSFLCSQWLESLVVCDSH